HRCEIDKISLHTREFRDCCALLVHVPHLCAQANARAWRNCPELGGNACCPISPVQVACSSAAIASASATIWRALSTCRFSISLPSTSTTPLPASTASACATMTRRDHATSSGDGAKVALAAAI